MAVFIVGFGALVFVLVGSSNNCGELKETDGNVYPALIDGSCWIPAAFTTLSFVLGGVTSIVAGYIGMKIAVYSNARTAIQCSGGLASDLISPKYTTEEAKWKEGFNCAFRAGSVMGFSLTGMGVLVLYISMLFYKFYNEFQTAGLVGDDGVVVDGMYGHSQALFECIAGFGLGGSSIALFGRVGGGIYTKAADVGADLVGKVEKDLPEDDIRNSACIADNVGDNVGDVAGMGADLFGSFAESSSAALVIAGSSVDLSQNWASLMFPIMVSAVGIFACLVTHFIIYIPGLSVTAEEKVERMLQLQLYVSTIIATPIIFALAFVSLPTDSFCPAFAPTSQDPNVLECFIGGHAVQAHWYGAAICVCLGLWGGLIIGIYTDYMTSLRHQPTQEVADSCKTGAATNIIYGLALGYKSVVVPVMILVIAIYGSWRLADMYGISLAALGMLCTLATGLSIDAYGPVCDNAGGFAEMANMDHSVRDKTDALDAAGNTTAAVGKGFAIGSAALVSLALFGAFTVRAQISIAEASILKPVTFAGLLVGAMLPYWFTAMTMKAVGVAAKEMIVCVRRQFNDPTIFLRQAGPPQFTPEFLADDEKRMAFYKEPIAISTQASLFYMLGPGLLVMLSPILAGFLFGKYSVVGLLAGGMVSGVQMAISQSNTGGAWDNAKKLTKKWKADTLYKPVSGCVRFAAFFIAIVVVSSPSVLCPVRFFFSHPLPSLSLSLSLSLPTPAASHPPPPATARTLACASRCT